MTTSHDVGREARAREVLAMYMPGCGALGKSVLGMVTTAMLAFADEATRPPAQAGAASVEVLAPFVALAKAFDAASMKHIGVGIRGQASDALLPVGGELARLTCSISVGALIAALDAATPAASGEIPGGMVEDQRAAIMAVTAEMRRFMPNACGEWADEIDAALDPKMVEARDVGGSFACPICGEEKPHHHTAPVVDAYQTKGSRK